jgi:hypothetical protein
MKEFGMAHAAAYVSITSFKKSASGIQYTSYTYISSTSFKLRQICNYVLTESKVMKTSTSNEHGPMVRQQVMTTKLSFYAFSTSCL